jgi:hypothetical protein
LGRCGVERTEGVFLRAGEVVNRTGFDLTDPDRETGHRAGDRHHPGGRAGWQREGAVQEQQPPTDDNEIKPGLQVLNTGSTALNLATVTVRYYFTRDGNAYNIWCDWAQVGCGNLTTRVVPLPGPVNGADAYLEVAFTGGTLAGGAGTGEIQLRLSRTDWQPLNEANDYSRGPRTSYADAPRITGHVNGTLVWGAAPS